MAPSAVSGTTGWDTGDLGSGQSAGITTATSSSAFTVKGAGTGVNGGSSDQMQFGYTGVNGDASIIARIASVQNGGSGSMAGIVVRSSLDPGSPEVFIGLTGSSAAATLVRYGAGSAAIHAGPVIAAAAPEWVMIGPGVGDDTDDGGAELCILVHV